MLFVLVSYMKNGERKLHSSILDQKCLQEQDLVFSGEGLLERRKIFSMTTKSVETVKISASIFQQRIFQSPNEMGKYITERKENMVVVCAAGEFPHLSDGKQYQVVIRSQLSGTAFLSVSFYETTAYEPEPNSKEAEQDGAPSLSFLGVEEEALGHDDPVLQERELDPSKLKGIFNPKIGAFACAPSGEGDVGKILRQMEMIINKTMPSSELSTMETGELENLYSQAELSRVQIIRLLDRIIMVQENEDQVSLAKVYRQAIQDIFDDVKDELEKRKLQKDRMPKLTSRYLPDLNPRL